MVKIREAIVVEGRYDKNTLSQIVNAPILETSGFGIFKDKAQLSLDFCILIWYSLSESYYICEVSTRYADD